MRRCLQLAAKAGWHAAPNPMVGAVVVCDDRIIGEGYHRRCGGPHAEVNAIRAVRDVSLLLKSTIYVSLEPCAHWGKTPPCADLIIEKGIRRVVIGCSDPFAKVNGLGIRKLEEAGCNVTVGVLEEECIALNKRFMTFHSKHRPFITLKWAQSSDGYIDGMGEQRVIFSNKLAQQHVHRMRVEHEAILVGAGTIRRDNPSLTARLWTGRQPLRLVVEGTRPVERNKCVFDDASETFVIKANADMPHQVCNYLYERGVQSLLVEGGLCVLQQFIDAGLYDEICVESTSWALGDGVKAPRLR